MFLRSCRRVCIFPPPNMCDAFSRILGFLRCLLNAFTHYINSYTNIINQHHLFTFLSLSLGSKHFVFAGNDLDSIRALFSEKEKELSLAVAKVEALTRQLEDVRRDRRAPLVLIPGSGGVGSSGTGTGNASNAATSPAAVELDKLRRELMVSLCSPRRGTGWDENEVI